jgi:hypothetical protein
VGQAEVTTMQRAIGLPGIHPAPPPKTGAVKKTADETGSN